MLLALILLPLTQAFYLLFDNKPWEIVYNETRDHCQDHSFNSTKTWGDTPDSMPIAWYSRQRNLTFFVSATSAGQHALTGSNLNSVTNNCSVTILNSTLNPLPNSFANYQWLQSVYQFRNGSIAALVHNEFHGFAEPQLGYCSYNESRAGNRCNLWSTGLAVSHDGGSHFTLARSPPNHLVAAIPAQYEKDQYGFG
eukprot:m.32020 g.32020  ORF g.32020 m.32020 type:complete len:196 (-) comp14884_c0_seq1:73-660(-)